MFGLSIEEFETYGMNFGIILLMSYMVFIIWQLSRESNAGRFGTFVLFLGLATGMVGFVAKHFIQWFFEH